MTIFPMPLIREWIAQRGYILLQDGHGGFAYEENGERITPFVKRPVFRRIASILMMQEGYTR